MTSRHARSALLPLFAAALPAQGYLVDSNLDLLFQVDLQTGAATQIASTANNGLATPADLAWRADTQEMWTIDLSGGELGTIDLTSGLFTPVVLTGISGWQGLAWDPELRLFFASNQTGGTTYAIDPVTGTTTALGSSGFGHLSGMEVDAAGTLWGTVFSGGALVRVDKTTGVASQVATTDSNLGDIAVDTDGTFYAANSTTDSLYRLDLSTGAATLIGAHGAGVDFVKGFAIAHRGVVRGGQGCADSSSARISMLVSGSSNVGSTTLQLGVQAGLTLPSVLLFGASNRTLGGIPLPFDLAVLGAPGCLVYTSSDASTPPFTSGAMLPIPVPNAPLLIGRSLFAQALAVDTAANALGVVTSDFARVVITR
ncbi:MAG: hypothetical protein R3F56_25275 [Planctomycetota bacterium]